MGKKSKQNAMLKKMGMAKIIEVITNTILLNQKQCCWGFF